MDKFLIENCHNAEGLLKQNLKKHSKHFELKRYFDASRECGEPTGENRKLKKILKRAVENEFAPQSLIDSIRQVIRS